MTARDPSDQASVVVYPDGPIVVRGEFTIRGPDGTPVQHGPAVALCRCGKSRVSPFCDGTHKLRRSAARAPAAD